MSQVDGCRPDARPRLRSDLYVVRHDGGTYLRSGHRRLVLAGDTAGRWLERLAPALDGSRTMAELTDRLADDRRTMVTDLVDVLYHHGIVRDASRDRPHRLSPEELDAARQPISFVEALHDSPEWRFERFRDTPVLVLGDVVPPDATASTVVGFGAAEVVRGPCVELTDEAALAALVRSAGAVLHVTDSVAESLSLADLCVRLGRPVLQAVVVGGEAWIGPVTVPDRPDTGWVAAWRRHLALAPQAAVERGSAPLPPACAAVVANQLAAAYFEFATAAGEGTEPAQDRGRLRVLDVATLTTSDHSFLASPTEWPAPTTDRGDPEAARAELDDDEFSRRAVELVDERVGVIGRIDEADLVQVPLKVATATVADPAGLLADAGLPAVVHGSGIDFATARLSAARRAVALHCAVGGAPEPGRHEQGWHVPRDEWTPVPAGLVFGPPKHGDVQVGPTWTVTAERVLTALWLDLTVRNLAAADDESSIVDFAEWPLDDVGDYCRRSLRIAGCQVTVYDVTPRGGLPTFACCLGERTVGYGCATTAAEALSDGLHTVLLAYQAENAGQPGYAPAPVPQLPGHRRGGNVTTARPAPARPGWRAIARLLAAAGHEPVIVPLDHDAAVRRRIPYVLRGVLIDG